ncbi:MAG: phosphoglycerate dehydrogenase [Candidatus Dadabacteria bacterium]|nr:phosphoglycerate dehydrogenase [Candidatus Dadabacteria bacterium]
MKVLITDGLSKEGLDILKSSGKIDVDVKKGIEKKDLLKIIKDYDALIVRSATKATKELLDATDGKLRVIGRAGIGVDNIDIPYATKKGIVVMNTPEANAITTAEHTIAMMFALARKIPQAHNSLCSGEWKRDKFKGTEVYGKTFGIIGLGNIGKLVAERAHGLKMNVIAYDPFITEDAASKLGVELVELDELIERAEIVTIHTPLTPETKDLINKDTFDKMKEGVIIINCARGGVVNEEDLAAALKEGKIGGAALDVYVNEPPAPDHQLFTIDENVVFTPHLGASTTEAQEKVGIAMAEQIQDFLLNDVVSNAVNMPSLSLDILNRMKPYLILLEKLGSLQGQLCKGGIEEIRIEYKGDVSEFDVSPLTVAALKGFLTPIMDVVVSFVNAPVIAKEKGINVVESKSSESEDYTSLVSIQVKTDEGKTRVSGTIFGREEPRIVGVNGFPIDVIPEGYLLINENADKPGFIGALCTLLGNKNVNIARMHLGRESIGGKAISFINIDSPVSKEVEQEISKLPDHISVTQVKL